MPAVITCPDCRVYGLTAVRVSPDGLCAFGHRAVAPRIVADSPAVLDDEGEQIAREERWS